MSRKRYAPPSAPRRRSEFWGDPDRTTGEPRELREFLRGPLARVSAELDSAYYGTVAYNRRVMLEWTLDVVFAGLRYIGVMRYGPVTPTPEEDEATIWKPRPKLENTYHWINKLHHIGFPGGSLDYRPDVKVSSDGDLGESSDNWDAAGWENFVVWREDVALGLSGLAPSRWRAFTFYMDGYDRSEIAAQMPIDGGEPWDDNSVRSALKEASGQIRRRSELHWPAKGAPRIKEPIPVSEITRVEHAIAKIRLRGRRIETKRGGLRWRPAEMLLWGRGK